MSNKKKKFSGNKFNKKKQEETSTNFVSKNTTIKADSEEEAIKKATSYIDEAKEKAEKLKTEHNVSSIHVLFIDHIAGGKPIIVYIKPITIQVLALLANHKDNAITAHEVLAQNLVLPESNPQWTRDEYKIEVIKFLSVLALKKNSTSINV